MPFIYSNIEKEKFDKNISQWPRDKKKLFWLEKNDKKHLIVFILLLFCVLYNVFLSLFFTDNFSFFFHFIIKSSEILGSGLALDSILCLVPSLITNVCRSGSLYRKDTFNRGVFGVVFVFLWNCVSSFNSIVTSFVLTGFFCDARVNWIGGGGSILYHPRGWLG